MTKRSARPGMAPSPNQQKVLDFMNHLESVRGQPWQIGMDVGAWHKSLERYRIGGNMLPRLASGLLDRQHEDGWVPWARSTVRDHLNDLVGKGHVIKEIVDRTAYYRPAPK